MQFWVQCTIQPQNTTEESFFSKVHIPFMFFFFSRFPFLLNISKKKKPVQQPVEPFYEIHEELFNGWDDAKLTVPIELVSIPGNHYNLFMSEFVGIVSEKIHEIVNGGAKAIADTFILQKTDLPIYDRYILYFAKRNDGFFVEWMVDKCAANVNCQDFEGRTALHHAVLHENKRTVQYLMEKGANVEICDTRGDSPLSIMKDKIDVFIDVLNSIKK